MIPHGAKDFNTFIELCNNLDWNKIVSNNQNINEETIRTNLEITLAILREYYNWSNSPF